MGKKQMYLNTLSHIIKVLAMWQDPQTAVSLILQDVKTALEAKGSSLLMVKEKTDELEVVMSQGLSDLYLHKGPVSTAGVPDRPVLIHDAANDLRAQYPEAAAVEGIASILSIPIIVRKNTIGALRIYTAQPWNPTADDLNFTQAVAQLAGMALEMSRLNSTPDKPLRQATAAKSQTWEIYPAHNEG
ncbi:MAG: GAF domain-containing protein [Deltaproteobacteria bacterium]|nr:GAF domain-containing protein [Deltaproteobacteria bacterium]MBF0525183.1 GAF domain-containing protein [Deltaproteobacteria bacterium]